MLAIIQFAYAACDKRLASCTVHRLDSQGIYMVTGATLRKEYFFDSDQKLSLLENDLLRWQRIINGSSRPGPSSLIIIILLPAVILSRARLMDS